MYTPEKATKYRLYLREVESEKKREGEQEGKRKGEKQEEGSTKEGEACAAREPKVRRLALNSDRGIERFKD